MFLNDADFVRQMECWDATFRPDQRLSEYTSLGVGGLADMIVIRDTEAVEPVVAGLRGRGIPWSVLGGGTNVLAADEPLKRVLLHLAPGPRDVVFEGNTVHISAAASLGRSVMECAKRNLGGMEGLVGVPGSVGGALRMNAGAYGTEIGPLVRSVRVFRGATGVTEKLTASSLGFKYRKSSFAPDDIMLSVTLELPDKPFSEIIEYVKQLNKRRLSSQPLKEKSAGCIFKNPPGLSTGKMIDELGMKGLRVGGAIVSERRLSSQPLKEKSAGCIFKNPPGLSTGKLIDELGMKGLRVGGAIVSERHANFIVNRFDGTASDIFSLMDIVRERFYKAHGIELEPEVIIWKN